MCKVLQPSSNHKKLQHTRFALTQVWFFWWFSARLLFERNPCNASRVLRGMEAARYPRNIINPCKQNVLILDNNIIKWHMYTIKKPMKRNLSSIQFTCIRNNSIVKYHSVIISTKISQAKVQHNKQYYRIKTVPAHNKQFSV